MIVVFAPAPCTVIRVAAAWTLSPPSWALSVYVPAGTTITSSAVFPLAAAAASAPRIVHATAVQPVPAVSAVVLTVNVAACAGAATASAKSPAKRAARTRISRH